MKLFLLLMLFVATPAMADTVRWVYNPHTRTHYPVVTESTPTRYLQHTRQDNGDINWEAVDRGECSEGVYYTVCGH